MLAPAQLRFDALLAILLGAALVMALLRIVEVLARHRVMRSDEHALSRAQTVRAPRTSQSTASSRGSSA